MLSILYHLQYHRMVIKIESLIIGKIKATIDVSSPDFSSLLRHFLLLLLLFFRNPFSNDRIKIRDDQYFTSYYDIVFVRIILSTPIFYQFFESRNK